MTLKNCAVIWHGGISINYELEGSGYKPEPAGDDMKDTLTYKGFIGSVHFSAEDKVFHGKIEGINDLVTFEGGSVDELMQAFYEAVDDYLELCKEAKKTPLKSYKGSFNVRVSPEVHGKAITKAKQLGISLNKLVQTAIEHEIDERHCYTTPGKKHARG